MQPSTYASLTLVFFGWLTIAWTGALVEMIAEGLLGGISGAVVGALFGTGDALAAFCGWIVLGIVISALINVVCSQLSNQPLLFQHQMPLQP